MPKGIKFCSECKTENGARAFVCKSCGHQFKIIGAYMPKKEKETIVVQVNESKSFSEEVIAESGIDPEKMSPDEHAHRIAGFGYKRAMALMREASRDNKWKHVNWKKVEELIGQESVAERQGN
jgi:hypothetical protein